MAVDKEALFKPRLPEADVEVPGIGTFRVRGLSRAEVLKLNNVSANGPLAVERAMLAMALVDPELSEGEVKQWQEASLAGELEPVSDKVAELSGMKDGQAKEAYQAFEQDPDAEFRVLPG
jgi:hypothetical protein